MFSNGRGLVSSHMKARTVTLASLAKSDRWRAEYHVHGTTGLFADGCSLVPLREVVILSTDAADPALQETLFYYVGLENVESVTGDGLGIERVHKSAVRSRSRLFRQGDILYGRLRPYLRKALLVDEKYRWGLCSTELLVLRPKESVVYGVFLRELLVSRQLTDVICRLQSGAALPRVSAEDLLSLEVPIPPLQEQREIVEAALSIRAQRESLKAELERVGKDGDCLLSRLFS